MVEKRSSHDGCQEAEREHLHSIEFFVVVPLFHMGHSFHNENSGFQQYRYSLFFGQSYNTYKIVSY